MKELVNRRIWHAEWGLSYFCSICGEYLPEKNFYTSKRNKWGVETRCKLHFTKKDPDEDFDTTHLKFSKVTEKDFIGAREILKSLGYDTTDPHHSIHQQFMEKYKLNK